MNIIKLTFIFFFYSIIGFSQSEDSNLKVRLGMTLEKVETLYPNCQFNTVDAWDFGVDGGGTGIEVLCNGEVQFFFWKHWKTGKVSGIVIVSPKIFVDENVHIGMSLQDLLKKYPDSKTTIDLLTYDESCYIPKKGYSVDFKTSDDNRAAEYDYDNGEPEFVKFINKNKVVYRITIR